MAGEDGGCLAISRRVDFICSSSLFTSLISRASACLRFINRTLSGGLAVDGMLERGEMAARGGVEGARAAAEVTAGAEVGVGMVGSAVMASFGGVSVDTPPLPLRSRGPPAA